MASKSMIGGLIDAVAAAATVVLVMAVDVEVDTMAVAAREDSGVVGVGHGGMAQVFAEGGVTRSSLFWVRVFLFQGKSCIYCSV